MRFFLPSSLAAAALSLSLIGCNLIPGTSSAPTPSPTPVAAAQEDPDEEGCEHLGAGGQFRAVTAAAFEATESIPTVNTPHTRYAITLVASGSEKVGKVLFNSAEATDHIFFLNQDVKFQVKSTDGTAVEIEQSATGSAKCDLIKGRHVVPLGVGGYHMYFGPTTLASVSLVVEEAEHKE